MSKKNKGGNKQIKKTAPNTNNNAPKAKVVANENKKKDEKQVAKETATPKDTKKEKVIPAPPENNTASIENGGISIDPPKKDEKLTQYTPDDAVKGLQKALAHNNGDHLSSDSQVLLLDLTRRTFVEENRTGFAVPTEVAQKMNYVVKVGIVAKLAESAMSGDTAFDVVMQSAAYPQLFDVAKSLGVTLPSIKSIEAHTTKEDKKAGNIRIPAGKGSGTKVSTEAAEQLKKDKAVQDSKPELDPLKITSEEDLKKALQYLLTIKDKSIGKMLVDVVDFMRNYRMNEASKANNSTEAMEKLDQRTTAAWLDDIFHYVTPSFLLGGIGKGMAITLDATGSPVRPFTILRESVKGGDGKPEWCDQDIADAVTCIITWVTRLSIEADEKNLAALGDPEKYDTQTKEIAEKYENSIAKLKNRLTTILSPDSKFLDTFLDKFNAMDKNSVTLYGVIRRMYYPQTLTDDVKGKKFKNLDSLIMNRIGYIFNLFRAADSKIEGYSTEDLEQPEVIEKPAVAKKEEADAAKK